MKKFDQFIKESSLESPLNVFKEHLENLTSLDLDAEADEYTVYIYGKFHTPFFSKESSEKAIKKTQNVLDTLNVLKKVEKKYGLNLMINNMGSNYTDFQYELSIKDFKKLLSSNLLKSLVGLNKYNL
jgi:hypothetical protein